MASYSPFATLTTKPRATASPFGTGAPARVPPVRSPYPVPPFGGAAGPAQFANSGFSTLAAGSPAINAATSSARMANSAQTAATVAPANSGPSSNAPARPAAAGLDYSSDPVLAQIRLLGQESVPNAIADADAAKKALLVQYGDPNVARHAVFGGKGFNLPGISGGPDFTIADTTHVGDEGSAAAAQQNPFSVLARLLHTHELQGHAIDNNLNDMGLYDSGERVKQLQEEQRLYQQDQTDAYSQLAQALAGIDSGVGQAYQSEADRQMAAERDAYLRALAAAAQNPPGAGPGGGGDNGGGGGGAAAPGATTPDLRAYGQTPLLASFSGPAAWANAMSSRPTSAPLPNAYNRKTVARLR